MFWRTVDLNNIYIDKSFLDEEKESIKKRVDLHNNLCRERSKREESWELPCECGSKLPAYACCDSH